jgi:signal transduction histidine kinase
MQQLVARMQLDLAGLEDDAQRMCESKDAAERAALCGLIEAATARLLAPCMDVVAFTGVGEQPLEMAETSVVTLLEDAVKGIRPSLAELDAQLLLETADAPATVTCDAAALTRSLDRLLNLNIASLRGTEATRKLEVRAAAAGPDALKITLHDTGAGMPAAEAGQLFVPGSGTGRVAGVGLAVARWLVERHGGSVSYRSEPGAGGTCEIYLPLKPKAAT